MRRGDPGAVPDLRLHDSREALLPTYPCRNWLAADLECLEESASLVLGCIITAVTINILPSKPNPLIPGVQPPRQQGRRREPVRDSESLRSRSRSQLEHVQISALALGHAQGQSLPAWG
jgi:hypothetical protein